MVKEGIVLGHKVSGKVIEVDRSKVDAIERMPQPRDIKGIRSFLGHVGFYRRFIRNFSGISKPLTNLLQKGVRFNFDDKCLVAFDKLKYALSHAPTIKPPIWDITFDLICEASDDAVGVTLGKHTGRRFNIIHHASRTLNGAQKNYPKEEKELFVVFSLVINFVLT